MTTKEEKKVNVRHQREGVTGGDEKHPPHPHSLSGGRGCVRSRERAGWLKVQVGAEFLLVTEERQCGARTLLRASGVGKPSPSEGSPELNFREDTATFKVSRPQLGKEPGLGSQDEL